MDAAVERKAKIRKAGGGFVVEENVDAVKWPHECVVCGAAPMLTDDINLARKMKNVGQVRTQVKGIPYCETCFKKVKATRRLDMVVYILALVFGIPLGLFFTSFSANTPGTQFVCCGLLMVAGIGIAWLVFYLIIRFPVKSIFKDKFVEETVTASLNEITRLDGSQGFNVSISITRPEYAGKFNDLNEVEPEVPV